MRARPSRLPREAWRVRCEIGSSQRSPLTSWPPPVAGNSSDPAEPHFVASLIVERNQVRANMPQFNITSVSKLSGIHYAWAWEVSPTCFAHFITLNEYAGHLCDGCAPVNCFYGPPCYTGWTYPEDSLGFLEDTLARVVGSSGAPVFVSQHLLL